jgi:hypothetical protein
MQVDTFTQSGRIMHWMDLAFLSREISNLMPVNFPERIYVPAKLANRSFPSMFNFDGFYSLERIVDPRIKKWSKRVPLDDRCGLMISTKGPQDNRLLQMLNRWRPVPWSVYLWFYS